MQSFKDSLARSPFTVGVESTLTPKVATIRRWVHWDVVCVQLKIQDRIQSISKAESDKDSLKFKRKLAPP